MKAELIVSLREELEYIEDTGPRCDCCKHCIRGNPDSVDTPLAHCMLFGNILGSFVVNQYGRCKQFEKAFQLKVVAMRKITNNVLFDAFVTAIEGGINYWSTTDVYHWRLPGTEATPDLDGFYAEISSEDDDWPGKLRIDADVIHSGIVVLASNATVANPKTCLICKRVLDNVEDAVSDVDANTADAIVQVGLFGGIVFG